ncbi:signal peptidase I [Microbacterium testaceum]|uniref:signal peptidase I n=1 Tax=Microbacterium testaceum TaxID=2033 RepID=UPI0016525E64|nr:signal peptidase I [Microbacterium testaceum]
MNLRRDHRTTPPDAPSHRGWARARAIVGTVVLAVVSLFALLTVALPLILGAQTYTVLTGSMQPGMPPGTLIAVRSVPLDAVRVGDVVTYQIRSGDPAVVTHRVVGTTSSTGGERLLVTRGDANDTDDPPVQSEQLRGTVVLAMPYLGYPGAVFGGQQRGAVVAAIGVAVVGYGLALLAFDALRARRTTAAGPAAGALIVVLVCAPFFSPSPASAVEGTDAAAPDRLLVSVDGEQFVPDGSVALFGGVGELVPGQTADATLWVRNAGADPARVSLRVDAAPASATVPDEALASALQLVVAASPVPEGASWVSEIIPAGQTIRLDVGLRMDAAAGNASRSASATVLPMVTLTQAVAALEAPVAHPPSRVLPWTGIGAPLALLVCGATLAIGIGVTVRSRRPQRR